MFLSIGHMPMEGGIRLDDILNFKQAAELLGVSERVLMKLLQEEGVPARKIGKEWRMSREALMDWLKKGDSRDYTKSAGDSNEEK